MLPNTDKEELDKRLILVFLVLVDCVLLDGIDDGLDDEGASLLEGFVKPP